MKIKTLLTTISIFLVMIHSINAIGISPGRTTLTTFNNGNEQDVNFRIINNENKNMKVDLIVEGELKDSIILKDKELNLKSNEEDVRSTYKVVFDNRINKPGLHKARIVAIDSGSNKEGQPLTVGATVAVATQLSLFVPYPDKYIDGDFYMLGDDVDKEIKFYVKVMNQGSKDIDNVKATIDIYDTANNKAYTTTTDTKKLNILDTTELVSSWNPPIKPGKYHAVITIDFDGKTTILDKNFELGYTIINLIDVSVKDFKLGSIAKFNILIENKANYGIDDVYADMKIIDTQGTEIANLKTPPTSIENSEKKSLYSYWDTDGVKVGQYNSDLDIRTKDRTLQKKLIMNIKENSIDIGIAGTGYVVKSPTGGSTSLVDWLPLIGIVLLIGALMLFYYKRKNRMKDFDKEGKPANNTKI